MTNIEAISNIADTYDLSTEQAREILFRGMAVDQPVFDPQNPYANPTEEEVETEEDFTTIYGIEYSNDRGTITDEQTVQIDALLAATGDSGQDVIDAALESAGVENVNELSATEAQILNAALSKAASDPATLWKWSFIQQITDPWHWLLVLGFGLPAAKKLGERLSTRWAARKATKAAAKAGEAIGKEILERQTTAAARQAVSREAAEQAVLRGVETQTAREAEERAVVEAVERAAAREAAERTATREATELAAREGGETAAQRLAAQTTRVTTREATEEATELAARVAAREAAEAAAVRGAGGIAARTLPHIAAGATALGALSTAALPFELAYMYLQPQVESYIAQQRGHLVPEGGFYGPNVQYNDPYAQRFQTPIQWGGFSEGGGGAFFGGFGRGLQIPGINEPYYVA